MSRMEPPSNVPTHPRVASRGRVPPCPVTGRESRLIPASRAIVWLVAVAGPLGDLPQTQANPRFADPKAKAIIEQYNEREVGAPGWRRVRIEMRTHGVLTRTFGIFNAWTAPEKTRTMLYYLETPEPLRGTRYLQEEQVEIGNDAAVYLFIPAGLRQVLVVDRNLHRQGLLGCDFSYADVRMTLPLQDCTVTTQGTTRLGQVPVWKVSVETRTPDVKAPRSAFYYFTIDRPFLLGAEYFDTVAKASGAPTKTFRVEDYRDDGMVRTAIRMTMTGGEGRTTTIQLLELNLQIDPKGQGTLTSDGLKTIDDSFVAQWTGRPADSPGQEAGK